MKRQAALLSVVPCHVLSGKPVATKILNKVQRDIAELKLARRQLKLVSVMFGDANAAKVYVRNQRRVAERMGIEFAEVTLDIEMDEDRVVSAIEQLNDDPATTGIIIQRPVPRHLSVKRLQAAIRPVKDVEGMHPGSIGQIAYGLSSIGPCTALAALELLKSTGLKIEGSEVVVIGHSEIVGKPLAFLLMAEGATVTVCHHMTRSVAMHARRADALIVAAGKAKLVGPEMVKPGAAVIDVGINQEVDENGKTTIVGDVDYDGVRDLAGWLTPVPGGVGPVTLAVLMRNMVYAARQQYQEASQALRTLSVPQEDAELDRIILRDFDLMASLGIFAHEMENRQPIRFNIELEARRGGAGLGVVCYDAIATQIKALVEMGHIRLVEEMAESVAEQCLTDPRIRSIRIRIEKLSAVKGAAGAGVEITRRAK